MAHEIAARAVDIPRGFVPAGAKCVTAAMDLGKYLCHWIIVAWQPDATGHVVDYGRLDVASTDLGVEQALLVTLRQFKDMVMTGWPELDGKQKPRMPDQVWIDSGYMAPVVYTFCREAGRRFRPAVGRGAGQQRVAVVQPPDTNRFGRPADRRRLPSESIARRTTTARGDQRRLLEDVGARATEDAAGSSRGADAVPRDAAGAPVLSKHLTAETKTEEFIAGKGMVVKWERQQRQNHWLDALYNACAAGRHCGAKLIKEKPRRPQPTRVVHTHPSDGDRTIDLTHWQMNAATWENRGFGR